MRADAASAASHVRPADQGREAEGELRDKSYVAINDAARNTLWTFTVPGHPAHPTVVCRQPFERPGEELRLQMDVQCNAAEAECDKLVAAFQELNQQLLQEAKKQQTR